MTVDLFVSLPDSLIRTLLTNWLDVRTLVRLDSAFCVKIFSPQLTQFYAELDWMRAFDDCALNCGDQYKMICEWILKRKLRLSSITFRGKVGNHCTDLVHLLIVHNANSLKHVTIWQDEKYDDNVADYVGLHCRKLESLSCSLTPQVSAGLVASLYVNLSLKVLGLSGDAPIQLFILLCVIRCPSVIKLALPCDITLSLVGHLVVAFPNVTELTLDSVAGNAVNILSKLPLRKLTLHKMFKDGAIDSDPAVLGEFSELQTLAVDNWTDNAPLATILANSPRLTDIDLYDYTKEGDEPLSAPSNYDNNILHLIAEHVGARLEELRFINVNGIPDSGLEQLALHCHNLREITIQACYHTMTEEIAIKLLSQCPKLTLFNIQIECTVNLLEAIVKHCPCMRTLQLDYFDFNVDEVHWVTLLQQASALRELNLSEEEYPIDVDAFRVMYRKQYELWKEMNEE